MLRLPQAKKGLPTNKLAATAGPNEVYLLSKPKGLLSESTKNSSWPSSSDCERPTAESLAEGGP
jgi:hypothetical protein